MVNLLGENFWLGFRVRTAKTQRLLFTYLPIELARTTSNENTQLNDKLRELELEVAVWKQQAISSRSAQDYESKTTFRRSVAFENGAEGKDVSAVLSPQP